MNSDQNTRTNRDQEQIARWAKGGASPTTQAASGQTATTPSSGSPSGDPAAQGGTRGQKQAARSLGTKGPKPSTPDGNIVQLGDDEAKGGQQARRGIEGSRRGTSHPDDQLDQSDVETRRSEP